MKQLDSKYVWQYFIKRFFSLWFVFFAPFGVTILIIDITNGLPAGDLFLMFAWIALCVFFFIGVFIIWLVAKLTYRFYKYELRKDGFRKESGIIWKKYHTIPYSRI